MPKNGIYFSDPYFLVYEIQENTDTILSIYGKIRIRESPYLFTQCCSDASIPDFEQVVDTRDVILTICGCWLLQNLGKRKKSNKFNRLQIEVLFLPNKSRETSKMEIS